MTPVATVTLPPVTENVADVDPCGTVTVAGTLAPAVFELESDITAPPLPAGPVRVTAPVPDWPATIVLGLTEILLRASAGGLTVIPNVEVAPEYEAVKVTGVELLTLPAVTENVAEVEPCGIVTDDGTIAPAGDELRFTVAPPLRAVEVSVTVQVDAVDGPIDTGLQVNPFKLGGRIVTVPPVVEVATEAPVGSASIALENWTEEDVFVVEADNVSVRVATTLFESA